MVSGCAKDKERPIVVDLTGACPYRADRPVGSLEVFDGYNHFDTFDNGEQVDCLPVARKPQKRVVYSLRLTNLKRGDIIMVNAQSEITNELPNEQRAMLGGVIILTDGPQTLNVREEVTEPYGYNCDRWVHHCTHQTSAYWLVKEDYEEVYLNYILYSVSLAGYNLGTVEVERDYGRMTGLVLREY